MHVNDNAINLADYKGTVKPCPICSTRTKSAAMDTLMSGRACKVCLGHGYVADCKNCGGTGLYKGRTVWDGGRSEHTSTCTPCGGQGVFATKKPDNWVEPPVAEEVIESIPATV